MQYNFALRVFDDTGKSFLENYIGRDYSDTLPTLEERHAIAIGKGIGLKQPVILQLNDMKYLQTNDGEKIVEKNECGCRNRRNHPQSIGFFNITKN